jgi:hypothetical protein
MKHRPVSCGTVAIALLAAGGCGANPPAGSQQGILHPGTAQIAVEGGQPVSTHAVRCLPMNPLTKIDIGDDKSSATVMVSSDETLAVQSLRITNVDGFTGSYHIGLDGNATVAMRGTTYDIDGEALGFRQDSPERVTASFTLKVAC